jgi:Uma2 family endonuclease
MQMAVVTGQSAELTPDDVLELPDRDRYELVDGRLVELEMSFKSQHVATRLARFLGNYCEDKGGYTCFPGRPNKMRRPDVSCVRADRLSFHQIGDGFMTIRPDLAVEVISPNDYVYDLEEKLDDYRAAGIPLVWLIYPPSRRVRVIRPEGPPGEFGPDGILTGEEILRGFRCPVADLFAGPALAKAGPGQ